MLLYIYSSFVSEAFTAFFKQMTVKGKGKAKGNGGSASSSSSKPPPKPKDDPGPAAPCQSKASAPSEPEAPRTKRKKKGGVARHAARIKKNAEEGGDKDQLYHDRYMRANGAKKRKKCKKQKAKLADVFDDV